MTVALLLEGQFGKAQGALDGDDEITLLGDLCKWAENGLHWKQPLGTGRRERGRARAPYVTFGGGSVLEAVAARAGRGVRPAGQ